jgi:hypothetical protein
MAGSSPLDFPAPPVDDSVLVDDHVSGDDPVAADDSVDDPAFALQDDRGAVNDSVSVGDPDVLSVWARDGDLSRGMGNYLRWPHSVRTPSTSGTKRSHPNDAYAGRPNVVPVGVPDVTDAAPRAPHCEETHSRTTRPRR